MLLSILETKIYLEVMVLSILEFKTCFELIILSILETMLISTTNFVEK